MRLLLVDNYHLFRESLKLFLSTCPEIETVLEADDADSAIQVVAREHPHIVLMDIDIPGRNTFDALREMRKIDPNCKIIFLTGQEYDSCIEEALDVQADGYILKRDNLTVLKQAIKKVIEGGVYFSESILSRLSFEQGRFKLARPHSSIVGTLTRRERELLTHLGKGASLKEAASAMHVSYKTADNQKNSLMRKLDIHDRVMLAHFAIREGVISPT